MATVFRVDPRIRAYGKARIDVTRRAKDEQEWQKLWKQPRYSFPFDWGNSWKHCIEYKVDDFAAEVGFFIDVLGLPVAAFSPSYAMFTSPEQDFFFSFSVVREGEMSTPPETLRMQFRVRDIQRTVEELEGRGIIFEGHPDDSNNQDPWMTSCFHSPHGISIELLEEPVSEAPVEEKDRAQYPDQEEEDLEFPDALESKLDADLDDEQDDLGDREQEDEVEDRLEDEYETSDHDTQDDEPRYEDEEYHEDQISFLSPLDRIRENKLNHRNSPQTRPGIGGSLRGRYTRPGRDEDENKPGALKARKYPLEN
jgi:catechol 2,3-dioxygenase-like lactoylglutathione lyase family enzyme